MLQLVKANFNNYTAGSFKVAVDNFCKQASKLTLAVAWDWLRSNSAAVVCAGSCFTSFVVALSFKSSLNWDERVAGKVVAEWTGPSQLELRSTDAVACRQCCWQRWVRARWANQLIPTSPVARGAAYTDELRQRAQRASLQYYSALDSRLHTWPWQNTVSVLSVTATDACFFTQRRF